MHLARHWLVAALILLFSPLPAWGDGQPPGEPPHPPAPAGRLDRSVIPERYRLDLAVDPAKERFEGRAEIDVALARPAQFIDLHGRSLDFTSVSARSGGHVHAARWKEIHPSGVLRLFFDRPLPAGSATLRFEYSAAFNDGPVGIFRINVDGEWYSWSQFQSIDARAAFPSFDQPDFKTPFEVTLRTPPGLVAVSNAPEVSNTLENGIAVHRFAPTLPLPTYLVAMMVGPFVTAEGTVPPGDFRADPLPLRIVTTRQNADELSFALEGSERIVLLLEDYFQDRFPFPKLDQVTSPVMPGAMENAGANLYGDHLLIMDEDAPVSRKRNFGRVVSHELGHQWFGDLVTPAWWDDIWLNESFANWIGYRIGDAWRPDLNLAAGALAEGFRAMKLDSLAAGRPVRQPIETSDEIDSAFDSITYGKGSHVIAMIADFMGEEAFGSGVRRFLAAHRYGSATSDDFFAALAASAGDPRIVAAMRSFVEQQGVPLLTFEREGERFRVSQSRYDPLGGFAGEAKWIVPLCVRRGAERQCTLLDSEQGELTIDGPGPLVPNAGGTGYYRFELPAQDWRALIDHAGRLPGGEAQALADSLSASVMAGRSGLGELVRLARKLVRHPDSFAAEAAIGALEGIAEAGYIDEKGAQGWKRFRGRLFAPLIGEFGFDPAAGAYSSEAPERSQRRAQIVDRLLWTRQGKRLRARLESATEAFMAGDGQALDPAWFRPAFDLYVRSGGEQAARTMVELALGSEDPVLRPAALGAAAGSGDPTIARWLLEDLDDPRLRASERRGVLSDIMSNSRTRDYGSSWILANLDALLASNSGIFMSARLPRLFGDYCSLPKAEELASVLRPRFAGTPGALELERTIEKVRNCSAFRERLGERFSRELAGLR
jgi:hypothetical protein